MADKEQDKKLEEYRSAQQMLVHYDNLNWRIGSIFIAASILITGVAFQRDFVDLLLNAGGARSFFIIISIPTLSLILLGSWYGWFERHKDLYRLRLVTLQRIELDLGLYHFLQATEADLRSRNKPVPKEFERVKKISGQNKIEELLYSGKGEGYSPASISSLSGHLIAKHLCWVIPMAQLIIILSLKLA